MKRWICWLALVLLPSTVLAFSVRGHMVVAQIAYDQLTPAARASLKQQARIFAKAQPRFRNLYGMAIWPDLMLPRDKKRTKTWHYIDIPYFDGVPERTVKSHRENVVWAIKKAEQKIADPNTSPQQRAMWFALLIHFMGDIHQPLHCISRYSPETPKGDAGGNLFLIQHRGSANLHEYWDRGLGLLSTRQQIKRMAWDIEQFYPPTAFQSELAVNDPSIWATQHHALARQNAYAALAWNGTPSDGYQQEGRRLILKQMALAGYRLAAEINRLQSVNHHSP